MAIKANPNHRGGVTRFFGAGAIQAIIDPKVELSATTCVLLTFASALVVKPIDFDKFSQLMNELGFYWLAWNHYPW